jgi:tetratricopeptide (TPR) repeat protein
VHTRRTPFVQWSYQRRRRFGTGASAIGTAHARQRLTDRDHPLLSEAIKLWDHHEFDRSLFTYERALVADPLNARIVINAARAMFRRNLPGRGETLLRSLLGAMPDEPRMHALVGETYRLMSLPASATSAFMDARRLGDTSVKTTLELAALHEQANRVDDARRLVEEAREREPESGWAALLLGQLLARSKQFEEAASVLDALVKRTDAKSDVACQAWAALAGLHDAAGDYVAAAAAIERCKQPQRLVDGPAWRAAQHVNKRFGEFIHGLTSDDVRGWQERFGSAEVPPGPAMLAGFPRSGTTLLEQILDAHPSVRSIEERDVLAGEIFPSLVHGYPPEAPIGPILASLPRKRIQRARARYVTALSEWSSAAGRSAPATAVLLDKNPGATPMLPILRMIAGSAPLIIAIRDPRDVVLSCYLRHLQLNPLSVNFLTIERTAAKYAFDIGAWLALKKLSPERSIEVRYEDLIADTEGVARRVVEELGLPWDAGVLSYRERLHGKLVTSPTYASVWEPISRRAIRRWERYESLLAPATPILQPFVRTFGYD